jgi:hypothetical protein
MQVLISRLDIYKSNIKHYRFIEQVANESINPIFLGNGLMEKTMDCIPLQTAI